MVRLSPQLLRYNFKYWKRYVYREMYRDRDSRKVYTPLIGWCERKKKDWYIDENQPWTDRFHSHNSPFTKPKKMKWIPPIKDWPFYKGDRVEILVGPDKGKIGVIKFMVPQRNWIFVDGLNCEYKSIQHSKDLPPLCTKKELPLIVPSQVKLVDPGDNMVTDVEWRYTDLGEKERVSVRSGRIIPRPKMGEMLEDYVYPTSYKAGVKDTEEKELTKVTFEPKVKLFEEDILESLNIKDDRKRTKTYWY